jgi:hypothetical protein
MHQLANLPFERVVSGVAELGHLKSKGGGRLGSLLSAELLEVVNRLAALELLA